MHKVLAVSSLLGSVMAMAGCSAGAGGDTDTDAEPRLELALTAASLDQLPACTKALAGSTAYVAATAQVYVCNRGSWSPVACTADKGGQAFYARSNDTLYACSQGAWVSLKRDEDGSTQIVVKGDGTNSSAGKGDVNNGNALRDAIAACNQIPGGGPSQTRPCVIELSPGTYDVGDKGIDIPDFVSLHSHVDGAATVTGTAATNGSVVSLHNSTLEGVAVNANCAADCDAIRVTPGPSVALLSVIVHAQTSNGAVNAVSIQGDFVDIFNGSINAMNLGTGAAVGVNAAGGFALSRDTYIGAQGAPGQTAALRSSVGVVQVLSSELVSSDVGVQEADSGQIQVQASVITAASNDPNADCNATADAAFAPLDAHCQPAH